MRAVLDVGQYVSATIRADGHPAQVLVAWREGQFDLVASEPILNDLRRVLAYPRIRKYHKFSDEEIVMFIGAFGLAATLTPARLELRVVDEDPTDDKIVACAIEGGVDYIASSDEHLLKLGGYEGITSVRPRRFLEILLQTRTE